MGRGDYTSGDCCCGCVCCCDGITETDELNVEIIAEDCPDIDGASTTLTIRTVTEGNCQRFTVSSPWNIGSCSAPVFLNPTVICDNDHAVDCEEGYRLTLSYGSSGCEGDSTVYSPVVAICDPFQLDFEVSAPIDNSFDLDECDCCPDSVTTITLRFTLV